LHKNKCPWYEYNCAAASGNGHLECLIYIRNNGCPWDKFTCSAAAINGYLNCLKYARENGCPWNMYTCLAASVYGHLNCFKYALENGCPWDRNKCLSAAIKFKKNSIITFIENFKEKNENQDSGNNYLTSSSCEICSLNKKCVAYEPCGHVSSCWYCASEMEHCPHCSKKIYSLLKVFFP
jgi:hypothetical protein